MDSESDDEGVVLPSSYAVNNRRCEHNRTVFSASVTDFDDDTGCDSSVDDTTESVDDDSSPAVDAEQPSMQEGTPRQSALQLWYAGGISGASACREDAASEVAFFGTDLEGTVGDADARAGSSTGRRPGAAEAWSIVPSDSISLSEVCGPMKLVCAPVLSELCSVSPGVEDDIVTALASVSVSGHASPAKPADGIAPEAVVVAASGASPEYSPCALSYSFAADKAGGVMSEGGPECAEKGSALAAVVRRHASSGAFPEYGRTGMPTGAQPALGGGVAVRSLPRTAAVLSCPRCFAVVCRLCQRHHSLEGQFRAADAEGVVVQWGVRVRVQKPQLPPAARRSRAAHGDAECAGGTFEGASGGSSDHDNQLYPVACSACTTRVGVFELQPHEAAAAEVTTGDALQATTLDSAKGEPASAGYGDDGIYHFFHVIEADG